MLRITPLPNTLAMVYRTKDTMSFTKYVNSRVDDALGRKDAKYHHVCGLYLEEVPAPNNGAAVEDEKETSAE
jgi:hypothetical protein